MVIHRHRNDFLRFLLPDHIFVQARLDLVRSRDILNIKYGLFLLFLGFLLELLLVWNSAASLQIGEIHKADIGILPVFIHIIQHVHQFRIVQHSLIIVLAHRIHGPVHAVVAYTDIIGEMVHLSRLTLRAPADEADILIPVLILIGRIFARSVSVLRFLFRNLILLRLRILSVFVFLYLFSLRGFRLDWLILFFFLSIINIAHFSFLSVFCAIYMERCRHTRIFRLFLL